MTFRLLRWRLRRLVEAGSTDPHVLGAWGLIRFAEDMRTIHHAAVLLGRDPWQPPDVPFPPDAPMCPACAGVV